MSFNTVLIISCFTLPGLLVLLDLYLSNRCPKGGQHDYKLTRSEFINGHDIGFGVKNSYRRERYTCTKCKNSFDTLG